MARQAPDVLIWAHNAHIGREWQTVHGWGQSTQFFDWRGPRNTGYWLDPSAGLFFLSESEAMTWVMR